MNFLCLRLAFHYRGHGGLIPRGVIESGGLNDESPLQKPVFVSGHVNDAPRIGRVGSRAHAVLRMHLEMRLQFVGWTPESTQYCACISTCMHRQACKQDPVMSRSAICTGTTAWTREPARPGPPYEVQHHRGAIGSTVGWVLEPTSKHRSRSIRSGAAAPASHRSASCPHPPSRPHPAPPPSCRRCPCARLPCTARYASTARSSGAPPAW